MYNIYLYNIHIYIYIYSEQKIWGCRLVKSNFSQLVLACGCFQVNFSIMSDLQIFEKLYDVRFMLCLIFQVVSLISYGVSFLDAIIDR